MLYRNVFYSFIFIYILIKWFRPYSPQVKGQKRRVGWFPANYVKLLGDDVNSVSNLQPVRTPEVL